MDYLDDSLELSVPCDCIVFMMTFSCSEGHDIEAGRQASLATVLGEKRGGDGISYSMCGLSLLCCQGPVLQQAVQ